MSGDAPPADAPGVAPAGTACTGRALALLVALTLPIAALAVADLRFVVLAVLVNSGWLAVVWAEARTLPGAGSFGVGRAFASTPRAGLEAELVVTLRPPAEGGFRWSVEQPWPPGWEPEEPGEGAPADDAVLHGSRRTLRDPEQGVATEARAEQPPGDGAEIPLALAVTPGRRGPTALPPTRIGVRRGLPGLAVRRFEVSAPASVDVQLDASGVSAWDRLRRSRSLTGAGVHRQRRLGDGAEFDQLRDYAPGDDHRDVDWKATARNGRPITTTYRAERQRDVVLCLDCGRMMMLGLGPGGDAETGAGPVRGAGPDGADLLGGHAATGSRLDAAVQTSLLLAHVAREQGDRVGLTTFADRVRTWLPPAAGPAARRRLADALAAARARPAYTDFAALASTLRQRRSHRSLILLFTDLEDPQLAADLAAALPALARRHAVVVLSLRDAALDRLADGAVPGGAGAATTLAARRLVTERDAHLADLRRRGVTVVHPEPGRLALAAIDAYLAGKARAFG